MKIKITLLTCLIMAQIATYAQKNELTIKTGASIPVGKYADTENSELSGYANTGLFIDLGYNYKINSIVGINGVLKYFKNGSDTKELQNKANKNFTPLVAREPNVSDYRGIGVLVGLNFNIPTGEKLTTVLSFNAGLMNLKNPNYRYDFSYQNQSFWLEQTSQTVNSLAYQFGLDFKYHLTSKIDLLVGGAFLGNKADLKDVKTTYSTGLTELFSGKASMNTINMGAGITYKF